MNSFVSSSMQDNGIRSMVFLLVVHLVPETMFLVSSLGVYLHLQIKVVFQSKHHRILKQRGYRQF
jgi:hypothetical protein